MSATALGHRATAELCLLEGEGCKLKLGGTMSRLLHAGAVATLVAALASATSAAGAGQPEWVRQFGTADSDDARSVAIGLDGRIHVVGYTYGNFSTPKGVPDGLLITFDHDGNEVWRRQFGTAAFELAFGTATDGEGNVYVVGRTEGAFGGPPKGVMDAFIVKYDSDRHYLWSRQPGTARLDYASTVATDPDGNVFVAGFTDGGLGGPNKGDWDAFVVKYDRDGHFRWKRQPGTTGSDKPNGIATDSTGSVYVAGETGNALGGSSKGSVDAFVIKYDRDGHYVWKRQPGTTGYDYATAIATDVANNVYVAGYTSSSLGGTSKGRGDAFLIKYDEDGHILWKRQPGTAEDDWGYGVAVDTDGSVFLAGINGSSGGGFEGGGYIFVIKYDRDGHPLWNDQQGTTGHDWVSGIAVDATGNAYVAGRTRGSLPGTVNLGGYDGFLMKYGADGPKLCPVTGGAGDLFPRLH